MFDGGTDALSSAEQMPADGAAPVADRFEAVVSSLPAVIGDEGPKQSNSVPGAVDGKPITGEVVGWTPSKVADQFRALFSTLEIFRGKHWHIDDEKIQSVGELWCPIFERHVPYTADNEILTWVFASGALIGALKEPLQVEFEAFKNRKAGSTPVVSTTVGSPASPE